MNQRISRQRGIAQLLGSKNIHNIIYLKKEIQLALDYTYKLISNYFLLIIADNSSIVEAKLAGILFQDF